METIELVPNWQAAARIIEWCPIGGAIPVEGGMNHWSSRTKWVGEFTFPRKGRLPLVVIVVEREDGSISVTEHNGYPY